MDPLEPSAARAQRRALARAVREVRSALVRLPLPDAARLPGTVVLPGGRPVRLPLTRHERRRALVRRAAAVALPLASLAASYLVVVRRPSGGDVVARMTHREVSPTAGAGSGTDVPPLPSSGGTSAGSLPPVVLVHGLGMSSRSMEGLVRGLGRSTRALAPDLPGYGRSPQPRFGMLDVEQLGDAVAAWMRAHDVGPAVLVGHSLGAQVAGEVALRAPDLVLRLVAVAPTGDPERPRVRELAGRLAQDALRESPGLWVVAALDYVRAGPGQMVALMRRALQRARQELDDRLEVPLLVVRGDRDPVCRAGWCEDVASSVPDGRCAVVPGAHGVAYDAPPELVDLVLDEVRAAAR
ncbi:alpha/beta hydrolase [Pseudokineococcus marinus]|uniref:Alpha/beta hydrolase n=1 Tax=Pseudokineococcus marinus TaxID=351215 RepID=A0A849BMB7_9ACTN|nr:alpha/beta hydrolase [Pseudokineococcus marinus]NNH21774.1 alpha/beta hydrolase [Pseudokineococcus marinus]